jgi:hypothetical protein
MAGCTGSVLIAGYLDITRLIDGSLKSDFYKFSR